MLSWKSKNQIETSRLTKQRFGIVQGPISDNSVGNHSTNGKLVRPPKHLTDRELWRSPNSPSERRRIERARQEAQSLFNGSRRIKDRELEDLFPGISKSRGIIESAVPRSDRLGNVQPYELIIIATICNYLKPDLVFEFGTFNGVTTLHFAMNSPDTSRIVTIDLDPSDPRRQAVNDDTYYIQDNCVGLAYRGEPEEANIDQIYADTTTFDHGAYTGKANLIFVDAGHEYELVKSDTQKALDMLAPNGVILWHDYVFSHYGVYTWLNELSKSLPLYSIPNATLVCYRRSLCSDANRLTDNWEAQMMRQRAEEWTRFQETRSYRTAMKLRRLREVL